MNLAGLCRNQRLDEDEERDTRERERRKHEVRKNGFVFFLFRGFVFLFLRFRLPTKAVRGWSVAPRLSGKTKTKKEKHENAKDENTK